MSFDFTSLTVISTLTIFNTLLLAVKAVISYRLTLQLELTRALFESKVAVGKDMLAGGLKGQQTYITALESFRAEMKDFVSFATHSINLMGDDMTRMGTTLKLNQANMLDKLDNPPSATKSDV